MSILAIRPYSINNYSGLNQKSLVIRNRAYTPGSGNNKGIVSFSAQPLIYQKENANKSGNTLKKGVSSIFQYDENLLSGSYFGEISDETKYAKPGWYLYKKEKENSPVFEKIHSMNPRRYIELYNNFYKTELKSAYDVAQGERSYIDSDLTEKIKNIYQTNGNLYEYFEQRLDEYFLNENLPEKNTTYQTEYKAYVETQKKEFSSKFRQNPLYMKPEDIDEIVNITNNLLNKADKKTYLSVYNELDNISQSLYDKNSALLIESFNKLKQLITPYVESEILPEKAFDIEQKNTLISELKNSGLYKAMNTLGQMDSLYSAAGLPLEQKAFFARQLMSDDVANRVITQNFLNFLVNDVPVLSKKQQLAKNVFDKVNIADSNFEAFKDTFIEDVRNKNTDSSVINKNLSGQSTGARILQMLPDRDDYLINILNKYTDEDLNKLLDKLKPLWLSTKYKEACEDEETKYDMSDRIDDVAARLTRKIDGKDVGLYEFVDYSFQKLYGSEAKLSQISEAMLSNILAGRMQLQMHDSQTAMEYKYIMEQMESLVDMLAAQNEDSKKLHLEISKVLDKLEKTFPDQSRDIIYVRSTFERLRDGIKKSIFPAALAVNTGSRLLNVLHQGVAAGAMTCDPTMLLVLSFMYGTSVYNNIKKEFDKPC